MTVFALPALGENHYSALPCATEDAYLQVENTSSDIESFWFQPIGENPFLETYMTVKAAARLSVPLNQVYDSKQNSIAIKTQTAALRFSAHCKGQTSAWDLKNNVSPWKKIAVPAGKKSFELYIANLAQQHNTLEVTFEGFWGRLGTQTLKLDEAFSTVHQTLTLPSGTKTISLRAEGRWVGTAFIESQPAVLQEEIFQTTNIPKTRYFLFTSRYSTTLESFIVPMQNPKLIQESLNQIANPDKARLLMARIEKSLAGVNKDLSSPQKTPWSWQVIEAQNYADLAHISCNGTPQIVEERLNSWMNETGGTICFWNYNVSRELTIDEVKQSPLWSRPVPGSLQHKHSHN